MPLDGITLRAIVSELSCLAGASVVKVSQPERDEIVFLLHTREKNRRLLLSASPESPRVQLTEGTYENPEKAPMFCMLLRKHFTGARLEKVCQYGLDRVCDITFSCHNELGDTVERHVLTEIMGRSSNIIITDAAYTITDCLRKNDLTAERLMMPGVPYVFPTQEKTDITAMTAEELSALSVPEEAQLTKVFSGFSPLADREAAGNKKRFVLWVKEAIEAGRFSPSVIENDGRVLDFWCFAPKEYGRDAVRSFETVSAAMDAYYFEKDRAEHMKQKTAALSKLLNNLVSRCSRKLLLQQKEKNEADKRDDYKMMGDLITANLYKIPDGVDTAEVSDWSEGEEVIRHIPLDKTVSPSANAQRYYKKYAKAKTAEAMLSEQMEKTKEELSYLESVQQAISEAKDAADIAEIREELASGGYVDRTSGKKKTAAPSQPLSFSYNGFTVLVGRNNRQNDFLTLKTARATDIFLHVKDNAGSHVIIKTGGNPVPDDVIAYAAQLAALHSKAKGAPKTQVDYTEVKHVKKPSGAKPGMVIYTDYKTFITE